MLRRTFLSGGLAAACSPVLAHGQAGEASSLFALPAQPLNSAPDFISRAGKPAILILFQPECPWCILQFREAQALMDADPGAAVMAVSLKGRRRDLLAELRKARADVPAYRSSPALLDALGRPDTTPRVYAVTADGQVAQMQRGLQKTAALARLLETV